jgi:hypothetical protein
MNYGTKDQAFSQEGFDKVHGFFDQDVERNIYEGVDHSFKKIDGIPSEIPYEYITKNVLKMVDEV